MSCAAWYCQPDRWPSVPLAGWGSGVVSNSISLPGAPPVTVWDVTDPADVKSIGTTQNNNLVVFRLHTDTLKEFTAFDGSSFYPVQSFTKIDNQDLHSLAGKPDLVIVTNPDFINQANTIATFHQQHDQMNVFSDDTG